MYSGMAALVTRCQSYKQMVREKFVIPSARRGFTSLTRERGEPGCWPEKLLSCPELPKRRANENQPAQGLKDLSKSATGNDPASLSAAVWSQFSSTWYGGKQISVWMFLIATRKQFLKGQRQYLRMMEMVFSIDIMFCSRLLLHLMCK